LRIQDLSFIYDAAEKTGIALDRARKQFFEMEFDDDAIEFQGDVMKSTLTMVEKKVQQIQKQLPPCPEGGPRGATACMPAGAVASMDLAMSPGDPKALEQMMQQSLERMPKEQRAQMQQVLKNMRSSGYFKTQPPVIEATGEQREVNGIRCAVERVKDEGQLIREDCRTTVDGLGLDAGDVKRLQRAFLRLQKFAASVRANLRLARMDREPADTDHLIVERRCFDAGKTTALSLRVRRESAPADWFTTPGDYSHMDTGVRGR
jgi:hypothetical protein